MADDDIDGAATIPPPADPPAEPIAESTAEPVAADGIPAPINPQTTPAAADDRVAFENWVNAEADSFSRLARQAMTEALIAGAQPGDVTIAVSGQSGDGDADGISEATAVAFAADAGLVPYSEWNHDALADECRKRGLKVSGTNDELIARLEASDAEDAEAATQE
jgi:hypothetical protein